MSRLSKKFRAIYDQVASKIKDFNTLANFPDEIGARYSVDIPLTFWGHMTQDESRNKYYTFDAILRESQPGICSYIHQIKIAESVINSKTVPQIADAMTFVIVDLLQKRRQWVEQLLEKIRGYGLCITRWSKSFPLAATIQMGKRDYYGFNTGFFVWDPRSARSPAMSFGCLREFDWDRVTVWTMPYAWQTIPSLQNRYPDCGYWYIDEKYRNKSYRFSIKFSSDYDVSAIDDLLSCMVGRPFTEEQRARFCTDSRLFSGAH